VGISRQIRFKCGLNWA